MWPAPACLTPTVPQSGRATTSATASFPEVDNMAGAQFTVAATVFLVALQLAPIIRLRGQAPGTAGHEHLTEVACVDVPAGEKRPEFGCFNVGLATGLHFTQASVYWHLRGFPSRKAAEAARSATGIVAEEDGGVWLSEFGPRTLLRREVKRSPSSDHCSFPRQGATPRFFPTL